MATTRIPAADAVAAALGMNHYVLTAATKEITHEESLRAPAGGGNSANWTLGHLLVYRNEMLEMLGEERFWNAGEDAPYRGGTKPLAAGAAARDFPGMVAEFERAHARIAARLESATAADLARPHNDVTVGEGLSKLQWHETYHVGQLGLLRRIAGKESAVG